MANNSKAFKVGFWLRSKVQQGATKGKALFNASIEAGKDFSAGLMDGEQVKPTSGDTDEGKGTN